MSAITTALPPFATDRAPAAPAPEPAAPAANSRRAAWLHASRRSIPAARTVAAADALVITAALLTTVADPAASPDGLATLLSLRIAIVDLGLIAAFALAAVAVFEIAGL